jgi:RNA polymerase sigma factor (TIGR02999 family)
MGPPDGEITQLLARMAGGDRQAEDQLIPLIYEQLRALAAHFLRGELPNHSLQATALVHEAYLRLAGIGDIAWRNRTHFFALAARTMRRILVDHARNVNAGKRRGVKVSLESAIVYSDEQSGELLELDEALDRLAEWDPRQARVVELRFFAGLSEEEAAEVLGVSQRTVKRDWKMAKAWLYGQLSGADGRGPLATP